MKERKAQIVVLEAFAVFSPFRFTFFDMALVFQKENDYTTFQ